MRLLVLADTEPPWTSIPHAITTHHADTLITAGDLNHTWLNNAHITDTPVPTIGIYGNHDNGTYLTTLDITNLHLTPTTINRTGPGIQQDSCTMGGGARRLGDAVSLPSVHSSCKQ
ncbi:hypothetical protein [Mycolicibacterium cosmeticum]|uniref:hypothetical protein n=1 Tax=Mycolicibacterium cosmeticum TaxID=258533 RepID=UPI003204F7D8